MTERLVILVDQDGVIADWQGRFDNHLRTSYPDLHFPFLESNLNWNMMEGLDEPERAAVFATMNLPGFYAELEPIPGAREALNEMAEDNDVFICTSPYTSNPTCASDKIAWIEEHIGEGWAKRMILTGDKTAVRGDILIDDKPDIKGVFVPTWEHILFTQPYNVAHTEGRRRMDAWSEWRDLLS